MATVAIVGASGYAGQETLDRVLAHPALELYALGSDSFAGKSADSLDPRLGRNGWSRIPRFITNEAALSAGADVTFVCLSHEEAAALEVPPPRGDRRSLRGAPIPGYVRVRGLVRVRAPTARGPRLVVVRAPRGDTSRRAPDRQPGLLRDCRPARARADRRRDRAGRRGRRRDVGHDRSRSIAACVLACGCRARERHAVPRR